MKRIKIVAAIILYEGKILCAQRGNGKYEYISFKYEFPGGKVEDGESNISALEREIFEELSLKIDVKNHFLTVNHDYPDFSIEMSSYYCSSENQDLILHEHIDYKWLLPENLLDLDWAKADLPIVRKLIKDNHE